MEKYRQLAHCGLYCGSCPMYIANQSNDFKELKEKTGIPEELLKCQGCRSDKISVFCRNCSIRKCNHYQSCFSCAECAECPCTVLKAFENDSYPHHREVITSLRRLKAVGKNQWLLEQQQRWLCPGCQKIFRWYDKKCHHCNQEVEGYDSL